MGWVKNLFELFTEGPSSPAQTRAYGPVRDADAGEEPPAPSAPGTAYVQLWLQEAWLTNDREWLNNYAPIVQSSLKFRFDAQDVAFPATVGDVDLGGGRQLANLQDAVRLRYPLSPPIPYNGGAIEFALALMRKRTYDGLSGMIGSVTELAKALKVAQLSSVLNLISPVTSVIDSVFGLGDEYVLGVHDSLSSDDGHENPVRPGYFAAINMPAVRISMDQLRVVQGRLYWENGDPFRDADFVLVRLGVTSTRSDLRELAEIFGPLEEAIRNGVAEKPDHALAFLQKARLAALFSSELTEADRNRLAKAVEEEYRSKVQLAGGAGDGAAVGELRAVEVEEMIDAVSVAEALMLSRADLLDEIVNA